MNNERFLVFDIDDTLYSQMEPLLTACEFSLGRKLPDPELFYRIFGKRSAEMFLFSESGQVSIHESRIYRIENTMKDLGIPFTREQAELFQERYKENQSHLHVSGAVSYTHLHALALKNPDCKAIRVKNNHLYLFGMIQNFMVG